MSLDPRRAVRLALLVLGAGLLVRFAYAWHGYRARYIPTGNDDYETVALSLVQRHEYAIEPGRPTSLREPGYVFLIAAAYAAAGERPGVVIFLQCLLSAATGWLLWLTARRLFDERTALAALAAFMLYPQSVYYCAYFFRETWMLFCFGALLWACPGWSAEAGNPDGDRGAWLGGLAATAFGMTNSAVLPACALSGLLIWLVAPAKTRLRRFVLYTAPLVIAFGAWTARNYAVQGRFIAGSTHGGEEFYRALIVPPDLQNSEEGWAILRAAPIYAEVASLPEAERNARMTKASFRWIAEHKETFLSQAVQGVIKYWRLWPYKMASYQHSYALLVLASLLSDGWIIPLGFLGLWLFRARWRELPVLPASILAMTGVYGAVHAVIRYRLPLMGGMILLACAALTSSWTAARSSSPRS